MPTATRAYRRRPQTVATVGEIRVGRAILIFVGILVFIAISPSLFAQILVIPSFERKLIMAKAETEHKLTHSMAESAPKSSSSRFDSYRRIQRLSSPNLDKRQQALTELNSTVKIEIQDFADGLSGNFYRYSMENSVNHHFTLAKNEPTDLQQCGSLSPLFAELYRHDQLFHTTDSHSPVLNQERDSETTRTFIHRLQIPLFFNLLYQLRSGNKAIEALRYCLTCADDDDRLNDYNYQFGNSDLRFACLSAIVEHFEQLNSAQLDKLADLLENMNFGNFNDFLKKLELRVGAEELRELKSQVGANAPQMIDNLITPPLVAYEWYSVQQFLRWCGDRQTLNFEDFENQSEEKYQRLRRNAVAYFIIDGFPNPKVKLKAIYTNKLIVCLLLRTIYCRQNVDQLKSLKSAELRAKLQEQYPLPRAIRYVDKKFSITKTENKVVCIFPKRLGSSRTSTINVTIR